MSDITKCLDADDCPKSQECYRNMAESGEVQSWGLFYNHHYIENDCVMFRETPKED